VWAIVIGAVIFVILFVLLYGRSTAASAGIIIRITTRRVDPGVILFSVKKSEILPITEVAKPEYTGNRVGMRWTGGEA
jgi:hypothetical protein